MRQFNIIWNEVGEEGKNINDFDKFIKLTKDRRLKGEIPSILDYILYNQGYYDQGYFFAKN